ncbi:MAG: flagellin [Rickettsiales bacterium]
MMTSLSLNTQIGSAYATARMGNVAAAIQHSTGALASGKAHQTAGEDVAAMAIATTYRGKLAEVRDSFINLQKSISMLDTADGGMQQINDVVDRMRALASMAQSGAITNKERSYLDVEYKQLGHEIDRIANTTTFGKLNILNGGDISHNVYLLNNNSLQRSNTLELTNDLSQASLSDLEIGGVTMTGTQGVLGNDHPTVDLLNDTLNANDVNNLQSTMMFSQNVRIMMEVKNIRMTGNSMSINSTTLTIDITSSVAYSVNGLDRITKGDMKFMQKLAMDAVQEQLRTMSLVKSDRALLKLHSGLDGLGDILFSTSDVTTGRLFGGNVGSLMTSDLAKSAFELTKKALDNLTSERVHAGSAREILEFEATFLQVKIASFDEIRALHEDTNITTESTSFALEQVQMQASIAVLTQTMRLHENTVEKLYDNSWR